MNLETIFTDEVIADFKKEIKKLQTTKAKTGIFTKPVLNALIDIIKSIDAGSLKTVEDLDDYVEEYYSSKETEYFAIVSIVQFADGEYDSVKDMFASGKKKMDIDLDEDMDDDGFVFELEDDDF